MGNRASRAVALTQEQAIGAIVEWASGGVFKRAGLGDMSGAKVIEKRGVDFARSENSFRMPQRKFRVCRQNGFPVR